MRKDTVNMAITGLGVRGMMLLEELLTIPAVRIAAVCDIYEDRMRAGADRAAAAGQARPAVYTDYREMLAAGGLDGVVGACDWTAHMPVTRAALKAGFPSAWRWAAPPACLNASSWFACRRKPAFPACCWKTAVTGGRKWRFSI